MNEVKPKRRHRFSIAIDIPSKTFSKINSPSLLQTATHKKDLFLKTDNKIKDFIGFEDRYIISKKVGQGTNGIVNQCYKINQPNIFYAVKKIQVNDDQVSMLLKRNYKIIKDLKHINLLQYKSLYLDRNKCSGYLIMEYFPYPHLEGIIMEEDQLKNLIYNLLETVCYLHQQGVCHRDLKTQNILYCKKTRQLKIVDFGICKKTVIKDEKQTMWTQTGTLKYKAPEMFAGGYNEKIDIWAIGIIMYQLVTGQNPFNTKFVTDTIKNIRNNQVIFKGFQNYSNLCQNLLKLLIKKNPQERLSAKQALNHLWFTSKLSKQTKKTYHSQIFNHQQVNKTIKTLQLKQKVSKQEVLQIIMKSKEQDCIIEY